MTASMPWWRVYSQTTVGVVAHGQIQAVDYEIALIVARREHLDVVRAGGCVGVVPPGQELPDAETRRRLEQPRGPAEFFAIGRAMQRASRSWRTSREGREQRSGDSYAKGKFFDPEAFDRDGKREAKNILANRGKRRR